MEDELLKEDGRRKKEEGRKDKEKEKERNQKRKKVEEEGEIPKRGNGSAKVQKHGRDFIIYQKLETI